MKTVFAAALLFSMPVLACPVCGVAANEQGQEAYKVMSMIMSVVPLLAIGSIVGWVALRVRAADKRETQ